MLTLGKQCSLYTLLYKGVIFVSWRVLTGQLEKGWEEATNFQSVDGILELSEQKISY